MNNEDINIPTPTIAAYLSRWRRCRDILAGEHAVKSAGQLYLPKATSRQTDGEYCAYKDNVVFYPAASRTADGLAGLVFRRAPTLDGPISITQIADTITIDGDSIDDFAEQIWRETETTDFTGILVDMPRGIGEASRANAAAAGIRPFLAIYQAESFLEVTASVVANRKMLTRVRLLEEDGGVRELVLEDGVYVQRLWSDAGGAWAIIEEVTPLNNGKALSFIPFVVANSEGKITPTPPLLENAVDLNLQHYRQSGFITTASYFLSAPIPWIAGLKKTGDNGKPIDLDLTVAPGSLWVFEDPDTKAEYLEFSGAGMATLESRLDRLEQYLATVGARILASDKAQTETAEALSIRRASENSALASSVRTISRQIEQALQIASDWNGGSGDVSFALNQDFLPTPMDAVTLTALVQAWQSGAISYDTLFYNLQQGEVISPTISIEDEQTKIEQSQADRPPTTPTSTKPASSSM